MMISHLIGGVVALVAFGCGGTRVDPDNPYSGIPGCVTADTCAVCGGNSPVMNTFPINGLSTKGDAGCNREGAQLMPRSLQGGQCGQQRDLDIRDGKLVGRNGNDVVCTDKQLVGASFVVRGPNGKLLHLRIDELRLTASGPNLLQRQGYRIVRASSNDDSDNGKSLCDVSVSNKARRHLGLKELATYTVSGAPEMTPAEDADLVIPLEHPIYDRFMEPNRPGESTWDEFNLACADDALAKLTLYRLFHTDDEDANLAGLHMLTATYCPEVTLEAGNRKTQASRERGHYTMHGLQIRWTVAREGLDDERESHWKGGQAKCIDQPRLKSYMEKQSIAPTNLPPELKPCGVNCTYKSWPDWAAAVADECGLKSCADVKDYDLTSYALAGATVGGGSTTPNEQKATK